MLIGSCRNIRRGIDVLSGLRSCPFRGILRNRSFGCCGAGGSGAKPAWSGAISVLHFQSSGFPRKSEFSGRGCGSWRRRGVLKPLGEKLLGPFRRENLETGPKLLVLCWRFAEFRCGMGENHVVKGEVGVRNVVEVGQSGCRGHRQVTGHALRAVLVLGILLERNLEAVFAALVPAVVGGVGFGVVPQTRSANEAFWARKGSRREGHEGVDWG